MSAQHARQLTLAAEHLERLGYSIVAREHRTRHGVIDVVAFDGRTLVFALVGPRGNALRSAGIPPARQAHARRSAAAWLAGVADRPRTAELRFDRIDVDTDDRGQLVSLDHLEGAF